MAQFVRHDVQHALDSVHRLGDAERAALGDAARRLVGEHAVHLSESPPEFVGAGADVERVALVREVSVVTVKFPMSRVLRLAPPISHRSQDNCHLPFPASEESPK